LTGGFHQLAGLVAGFPGVRVLCLGDLMVDRYVYGRAQRISAEAPIPIITHQSERVMLGGVGTVARNVAALRGKARIVAVVGDDDGGREVARLIAAEPNLETGLVVVPTRRTTVKVRYLARGQQLLRVDREDVHPLEDPAASRLIEAVEAALGDADVMLLSDYAKGCLGERLLRRVIGAGRAAGKPVLADPKSEDFSRYDGVSLLKPNAGELGLASGIACDDDASTIAAARRILEASTIGAVLVTRSELGMTLVARGEPPRHFREPGREVYDVSGAGDTALAVLGLAAGAGGALADAVTLANKACGIVVAKLGTAVVYASELMHALQAAEFQTAGVKVVPLLAAVDKVTRWRAAGLRIGFTNGCFDLIHAGHVSLLSQAKESCDRLVVGLNSDDSVRRLKGEGRPINAEAARAIVLASLQAVDAVVLFDEDTPMNLIDALRPEVLIKGADYTEDQVVGADFVKSYGGRVHLARLAPEASTTGTINRIRG
jgi:D-beta-D-heptose 7-phosphate kinase/D-beta-D-heptose 1-phosphate adenosyltransferase